MGKIVTFYISDKAVTEGNLNSVTNEEIREALQIHLKKYIRSNDIVVYTIKNEDKHIGNSTNE